VNPEYAAGLNGSATVKLELSRSSAWDSSFDKCSNTCRPLVDVSLRAVVFLVLTTPFTRKATTATIRMHATPSATAISTSVIPCGDSFMSAAPLLRPNVYAGGIMGRVSRKFAPGWRRFPEQRAPLPGLAGMPLDRPRQL
jgi:hypothetical protein